METDIRSLKTLFEKSFALLDSNYPAEISFLHYKNNFELLIAVILSAQTTDRQVMEVIKPLFNKYPDAAALAKAKVEDVIEIIKPVGFHKVKAQNIIKTAKKLTESFNSTVPATINQLITLPGVGRKSANVVVGTLFNLPAIIVDTHFGRVVKRIGLTKEKDPEKVEKDIAKIVPENKQFRFSMTANLHGRAVCHSRNPMCASCFLEKICKKVINSEV